MNLENYQYITRPIKKIFDKAEGLDYTKKSRKYQHILYALLTEDDKYQKITSIQRTVLERASDLMVNQFNDNGTIRPSGIYKNQNHQFNKYLKELEDWGLVTSKATQSTKGQKPTKEFHLSAFGRTFALMIQTFLSEDKNAAFDELFEDWKAYLSQYPTTLDKFCLLYFGKRKNQHLFEEFIDYFIKNTVHFNHQINNNTDLFTLMLLVKLEDHDKNERLFESWYESLYELEDEKTKEMFLFHMKTHLTRLMVKKVKDYAAFEDQVFASRVQHTDIVVEVICSCEQTYYYFPIAVLFFVQYLFTGHDRTLEQGLADLVCNICNTKGFKLSSILDI